MLYVVQSFFIGFARTYIKICLYLILNFPNGLYIFTQFTHIFFCNFHFLIFRKVFFFKIYINMYKNLFVDDQNLKLVNFQHRPL